MTAKNHLSALYTSNSGEWRTPKELFNLLQSVFDFSIDAAATPENALCKIFYTKETDGLIPDWPIGNVWINPPYGRSIIQWIRKAEQEFMKHQGLFDIVLLLPARTDTEWFLKLVQTCHYICFINGRINFLNAKGESQKNPTFPSLLAIYSQDNGGLTQAQYEVLRSLGLVVSTEPLDELGVVK